MAILAALMTAIAAAEFVVIIARAFAPASTLRAAELQAALQFAASLETAEQTASFIDAYLRGDRFALAGFGHWPDFRDEHVAFALDTTA